MAASNHSPDATKLCACGSLIERGNSPIQRWRQTRLCQTCERARLKQRIRDGSPVDERGCWIWASSSTDNGYGRMSVNHRWTRTHRLSYRLFVGDVPPGMHVCHHCDVKRCNNPSHLFLGDHQANNDDMWAKGRGRKPPAKVGLANSNATLTFDQVEEIRALRAAGVGQREVARRFGCAQTTVWRITHRIVRRTA